MREPLSIPKNRPSSSLTHTGGGASLKPLPVSRDMPRLQKPCRKRLKENHSNQLIRGATPTKIKTLDTIVALAGEKPKEWIKPKYGDFDYWLARHCGWVSDHELEQDANAFEAMRQRSRNTSIKYRWEEGPRYEAPKDTGEYIPEVSMSLIKDRNLTDSARRIALFVMRHAYQDNRDNRNIMMTVSFMMKGLSLSRRTVQRNLTLLQKHGYMQSDVVPSSRTRMSIGLMISLLTPLFPKHHKEKWPKKRRNLGASQMTHKHDLFTSNDKNKDIINRRAWHIHCVEGILRRLSKINTLSASPIPIS